MFQLNPMRTSPVPARRCLSTITLFSTFIFCLSTFLILLDTSPSSSDKVLVTY